MNTAEDAPIVGTVVKWFGGLARGGKATGTLPVVVEENTI